VKGKRRAALPALADSKGKWVASSAADVAFFFGVATQTLSDWKRDGMPGEKRSYDLKKIYDWKVARDKKREELYASRRKAAVMGDPDHAYKQARARMMQLRVEQEERQLMAVEAHDDFVVRLCATFRNGLFATAATLAAHVEGLDEPSRLEVIEEAFTDLLAAFADGPARGPDPAVHAAEAEVPGGAAPAAAGDAE
jgi:hypothetical protein